MSSLRSLVAQRPRQRNSDGQAPPTAQSAMGAPGRTGRSRYSCAETRAPAAPRPRRTWVRNIGTVAKERPLGGRRVIPGLVNRGAPRPLVGKRRPLDVQHEVAAGDVVGYKDQARLRGRRPGPSNHVGWRRRSAMAPPRSFAPAARTAVWKHSRMGSKNGWRSRLASCRTWSSVRTLWFSKPAPCDPTLVRDGGIASEHPPCATPAPAELVVLNDKVLLEHLHRVQLAGAFVLDQHDLCRGQKTQQAAPGAKGQPTMSPSRYPCHGNRAHLAKVAAAEQLEERVPREPRVRLIRQAVHRFERQLRPPTAIRTAH